MLTFRQAESFFLFAVGFISGANTDGVQPCQSGRFREIFHILNFNSLLCPEVIVPLDFGLKTFSITEVLQVELIMITSDELNR